MFVVTVIRVNLSGVFSFWTKSSTVFFLCKHEFVITVMTEFDCKELFKPKLYEK